MEHTTEHQILLAVRDAEKPYSDKYAPMRGFLLGMGVPVQMIVRHLQGMMHRDKRWIRVKPDGWNRVLANPDGEEVWIFLEDAGFEELKRRERDDTSHRLTSEQIKSFPGTRRMAIAGLVIAIVSGIATIGKIFWDIHQGRKEPPTPEVQSTENTLRLAPSTSTSGVQLKDSA